MNEVLARDSGESLFIIRSRVFWFVKNNGALIIKSGCQL